MTKSQYLTPNAFGANASISFLDEIGHWANRSRTSPRIGAKAKLEHTRIESRNAGMLESIFSICQGKCADGKMKSFK
jgi:hypothetical protein